MSDSGIEIEGLEELKEKLDELATKDSRKILRDGLKSAGQQITGSMQAECSSLPGEIGEVGADPRNWYTKIRTQASAKGEAGLLQVSPTGGLDEEHTAKFHKEMHRQPAGRKYHRSLRYLLNLMRSGPKAGKSNLPHIDPMTQAWTSAAPRAMNAFIDTCKEVLGL